MLSTLRRKVWSRTFVILPHAIIGMLFGVLIVTSVSSYAQEADGARPLLTPDQFQSILPEDARLLDDASTIESFLDALDGTPPNWKEIYRDDGSGHDERLFALNRERDRLREGHDGITSRLTFLWAGELSTYDSERGGFHVAIGPKLTSTRWGLVRFKPEDLPSTLVAVPPPTLNESLQRRVGNGERIEIDVAITGRLISDESIIYDFAHEEPGQGMVMPVVRVEQIDYLFQAYTLLSSTSPASCYVLVTEVFMDRYHSIMVRAVGDPAGSH
jgi:hypothetical protein